MQAKSDKSDKPAPSSLIHIYDGHLATLEATIDSLAPGQLADRYHQSLKAALETMSGQRGELAALFGMAMADEAGLDLMRGDGAERLARAYHRLVLKSDDALPDPKALQMGIALYAFHMLALLFWLYDRSPDQAATRKLLPWAHELFKLLRPLYLLPLIPQGVARLASIVMPELLRKSQRATAQNDARDGQHQDFDIHRK